MKNVLFLVVGFSLTSNAWAAPSYAPLQGEWKGTIVTNVKDLAAGGKPTAGETGVPATVSLNGTAASLKGATTVADSKETVAIEGETYVWDDGEITVVTKWVNAKEVPDWVKKQAKVKSNDSVFAFKYSDCTVNKTKAKCETGKNLPGGLESSGVWLFKVNGNNLMTGVYYTYPSGGKRILEESLAKGMK